MNKYVIKFDLTNLPESNGAVASDTPKSSAGDDVGGDGGGLNLGDAYGAVKKATYGIVSLATAKAFADQIVSYKISQVSLETGATEYEQRLNTLYAVGNGVAGAGMALISGALIGGPAGFAAALAGVAIGGVKKAISIEQNRKTLETQADLENISIGMQRRRAGFTGSRSDNQ